MPKTINENHQGQIIGGIFSDREKADKAVAAFNELYIPPENIQVVIKLNNEEAEDSYTGLLMGRGVSESHALYYNKVVREGKIFVAVYDVPDPAAVIDIFDKYQAEYNPNGSRNLRQDVLGMTAGAVVGAVAMGAVGAAIAGPAGAAAGAAMGMVVGGGSGAAAGKMAEHSK